MPLQKRAGGGALASLFSHGSLHRATQGLKLPTLMDVDELAKPQSISVCALKSSL